MDLIKGSRDRPLIAVVALINTMATFARLQWLTPSGSPLLSHGFSSCVWVFFSLPCGTLQVVEFPCQPPPPPPRPPPTSAIPCSFVIFVCFFVQFLSVCFFVKFVSVSLLCLCLSVPLLCLSPSVSLLSLFF